MSQFEIVALGSANTVSRERFDPQQQRAADHEMSTAPAGPCLRGGAGQVVCAGMSVDWIARLVVAPTANGGGFQTETLPDCGKSGGRSSANYLVPQGGPHGLCGQSRAAGADALAGLINANGGVGFLRAVARECGAMARV